ncbi:glycosyltransferase family 2 protein [Actinopolymorpha pittospori]|uniref:Glycosyltransferase involved in cell wall biosynthesis n=1 Tax=Actinopolymorpha pittospori TaxID=648752 RepID=A0A927MT90_9ACTN|nr:glycosyltransferase family 2 protein [Actinopolymorpha pittospori]MBE1606501.1 glycosyltransferase involved in cell wall biosynthesis [Actinopolymorpha pittospori]
MTELGTAGGTGVPGGRTVSVILPTYNRCDVVETTLRHFMAQDYPAELMEVLVADNSSDGTPEMVRRVAAEAQLSIQLVSSEERLPAVKRNQALRQARGDLVLWMNDDVWVRPDMVRRHVEMHARHDAPIAVLGHVEQSEKMPANPFTDWYQPFSYWEIAGRAGQTVPYRYHWSMNLSLPRQVMLDRNLVFHEDWANIGHEDIELGYRWTRAGYEIVYEPRAWGEHYHPHDLPSACRLQESVGRGLRDLEVLIPEPDLLERYGVLSRNASPRGRLRMAVRNALFNRFTVPPLQTRLAGLRQRNALAEWLYWKVLLFHTEQGYHTSPPRRLEPTPTWPPGGPTPAGTPG